MNYLLHCPLCDKNFTLSNKYYTNHCDYLISVNNSAFFKADTKMLRQTINIQYKNCKLTNVLYYTNNITPLTSFHDYESSYYLNKPIIYINNQQFQIPSDILIKNQTYNTDFIINYYLTLIYKCFKYNKLSSFI